MMWWSVLLVAGCMQVTVAEKADVTIYVMSKCPDMVPVQLALIDAVSQFPSDLVNFKVQYIAQMNSTTGMWGSKHGQPELDGDMFQLCSMYSPQSQWMR